MRHLVLFGGEGLSAAGKTAWMNIYHQADHPLLAVIPAGLADHKVSARDYRLNFIEKVLTGYGFQVVVINSEDDHAPVAKAGTVFLPGGRTASVCRVLDQSLLWELLKTHSLLVASGGSVMALGETILVPPESPPEHLEDVVYTSQPGLGYLSSNLLPFCDQIPDEVLPHILRLLPEATPLFKLHTETALIIQGDQWRVEGQGYMELVGGPKYAAGQNLPPLF